MSNFNSFVLVVVGLFFGAVTASADAAKATLEKKSGSNVTGTVEFSDTSGGLHIKYNLKGLKKNQRHGFHIHEKGDCTSPDAKSAGEHYVKTAPSGGTSKESPARHAGDLPEVRSDENGMAQGELIISNLTIGEANAVINRAIMVHGGPDDLTKKSAPRVACGVILKL